MSRQCCEDPGTMVDARCIGCSKNEENSEKLPVKTPDKSVKKTPRVSLYENQQYPGLPYNHTPEWTRGGIG